jgi:hypothetical protein
VTQEYELLDEQVEFDARHGQYMKIAEVIISLSAASIAFIPQLRVPYRSAIFAYCLVLLGAAVLLCVLFMALLTFFYCFALSYLLIACRVGWAICRGGLNT